MRHDRRVVESNTAGGLPELVQVVERLQFDDAVDLAPATVHRVEDREVTWRMKRKGNRLGQIDYRVRQAKGILRALDLVEAPSELG